MNDDHKPSARLRVAFSVYANLCQCLNFVVDPFGNLFELYSHLYIYRHILQRYERVPKTTIY
jgi:hypothetical protein